jgi:hypothetical protein
MKIMAVALVCMGVFSAYAAQEHVAPRDLAENGEPTELCKQYLTLLRAAEASLREVDVLLERAEESGAEELIDAARQQRERTEELLRQALSVSELYCERVPQLRRT